MASKLNPQNTAFVRWITSHRIGVVRVLGLSVVLSIASASGPIGHVAPYPEFAIPLGAFCIAGFLWLAATGSFGYGSARPTDWIAVIPFLTALALAELYTPHSIQEIEIHFAQGLNDKHSFVYPLLQLFFVPLTNDAHIFTMRMNAVIGAFATLPLYLFVRQRVDSRAAGLLCALFLATHPTVVRFMPTDAPYAFLLATWFSGLALLSAPTVDGRSLFGGIVFLGLAASARVEGLVLVAVAAASLDIRAVMGPLRRHRVAAAAACLVVVGLVSLQMALVLQYHSANLPAMPTVSVLLESALAAARANGTVFTYLVAIGVVSGVFTRHWLGVGIFVGMLVVVAPMHDPPIPITLHRHVPLSALQAILAGLGAYTLVWCVPRRGRWRWLAALPGCAAAFYVLIENRVEVTRPYVFNVEYDLLRRHLAPQVLPGDSCTLLTFPARAGGDVDIHSFHQVVPNMTVVDCHEVDCIAEVEDGICVYYLRSASCYFRRTQATGDCGEMGTPGAAPRSGRHVLQCLHAQSAAFEAAVDLEPVELHTVELRESFPVTARHYPRSAEVGLFRAR